MRHILLALAVLAALAAGAATPSKNDIRYAVAILPSRDILVLRADREPVIIDLDAPGYVTLDSDQAEWSISVYVSGVNPGAQTHNRLALWDEGMAWQYTAAIQPSGGYWTTFTGSTLSDYLNSGKRRLVLGLVMAPGGTQANHVVSITTDTYPNLVESWQRPYATVSVPASEIGCGADKRSYSDGMGD